MVGSARPDKRVFCLALEEVGVDWRREGRTDDAADRLDLLDLLALDAQKLRQPPAFADGHKIEPGCRATRIQFRLDDKVWENTLGGELAA